MTKVIFKKVSMIPAFLFISSCASFKTIDPFPRDIIQKASKDGEFKPYAKILVRWRNYPFTTFSDTIGYTDEEKAKIKPEEVPYGDYAKFKAKALKYFKEAGLYDPHKGEGTVKIDLMSFGRWTYSELSRSFLTETSFIYILPRSIKVNYYLKIEAEREGKKVQAEEISSIKTVFHLLIFPLYPFSSFSSAEKSVLKNILWKSAADIYALEKGLPLPQKNFDEFIEKGAEKPKPPEEIKKQDF